MLGVTLLLIILTIICIILVNHIKMIRTGDPNENESTYWMFSYDFKSQNKEWVPENNVLLKRKRNIQCRKLSLINTDLKKIYFITGKQIDWAELDLNQRKLC